MTKITGDIIEFLIKGGVLVVTGTMLILFICGVGWGAFAGTSFFISQIGEFFAPTPISSYAPEHILKGFCVDDDHGAEIYEFTYKIQSEAFDDSNCTFKGIRTDILGCTFDDFYSYRCKR